MSALGIRQKLLSAASVQDTKGTTPTAFKYAAVTRTTHHIQWGTGVTAGAVIIETADDPSYTGTWAPIATITYASGSPKNEYASVEGTYGAIRHRVSTTVANGTVTTYIEGV